MVVLIFSIIFTYVLSCIVISQHIRITWWLESGCNSSIREQTEHGPEEWAFWISLAFIIFVTLYIFYKMYKLIY